MTRLAPALLYLPLLLGGLYASFAPTLASRFALVQSIAVDSPLNHYLLEHTWRCLTDRGYAGTWWTPAFFHPQPLVIGYSENLFGAAPVYWLFRAVVPPVPAYGLWMIAWSAANFAAMGVVLRWWRLPHPLAGLGAYLWAFGLPHLTQIYHSQTIPRAWMPFALHAAARLAERPGWPPLRAVAWLVAAQAACCVYTGWLLALGLLVYLPAGVWANGTGGDAIRFARGSARRLASFAAAWGLGCAAFFAPYFLASNGTVRGYGECVEHLPTVSAWFASADGGRWADTLRPVRQPVGSECQLFAGFGLYLLAAGAAAWAWRRPDATRVRAGLVAAAVLVALTLNYGYAVSPWAAVRLLPGGLAIRAVGRVFAVVHLFAVPAALLASAGWARERLPGRWRPAAFALVGGAVLFEQTGHEPPAFPADAFYAKADRLAALVRGADAAYLAPGSPKDEFYPLGENVLAMWAGLAADVPVVNGYSGRLPDGHPGHDRLTDELVVEWLRGGGFRGRVAVVEMDDETVRHLTIE